MVQTELNIPALLRAQRAFFATGETKSVKFRKTQLGLLRDAINANEQAILSALHADLRKPAFEGYGTEVGFVLADLKHAISNLAAWAAPRSVSTPLFAFPASSEIRPEPYGVTLIIAPWNYPFQLLLAPLVGAMAAGNCAMLKPSELAPSTSAIITKIIRETFSAEYIAVVEGGIEESKVLLEQRWDYIFFTGGTEVGRVVYQAAAKHLTPVTLELGGKSPCIVDSEVNIDLVARRIVWGKFVNAGQTCIAPDYILADRKIKKDLIIALGKEISKAYGENPLLSDDYCRIINDKHYKRLKSYLSDGLVAHGGETNDSDRYIAPTILDRVSEDSRIMQDEIFGPILPILGVDDIEEAIEFVNARPKPLALYLFTRSDKKTEKVLGETSSGGACINDTLMHIANGHLPFGGVGDSGIGAYHGQSSFDLFSHLKSVMNRSNLVDLPVRYAPYKKVSLANFKRIFKVSM